MNTTSHTTTATPSPVALQRLGQLLTVADAKTSPRISRRCAWNWPAVRRAQLA